MCVFLSLLLTHAKANAQTAGQIVKRSKNTLLKEDMTWPTSEQSTLHRSREYSSPSVTDRISLSKYSKYSLSKKKNNYYYKSVIIIEFIFIKCIN